MSGDVRFGMLAPFVNYSQVTTPSGRTQTSKYRPGVYRSIPLRPDGLYELVMREHQTWRDYEERPWTTTFDKLERTWTYQTPENRQSAVTLDSAGRVASRQWPGMAPITYAYYPTGPHLGRLQSITQATRAWSVEYDAAGNLATLTNPLGETTSMSYDAANRPDLVTLPDLDTIGFGFDPMGRLTSLDTPSRNEHAFSYDARGLESSYTPPDTASTTRAWDPNKRLTRIDDPNGTFRQVQYDPKSGDPNRILHEGGGSIAFDWNVTSGQLEGMTSSSGILTRYQTDGPLLDSVEWKDGGQRVGSVDYGYAEDSFLRNSVIVRDAQETSEYEMDYEHDADGLIISVGQLLIDRGQDTGRVQSSYVMGEAVHRTYDAIYGELSGIWVETSEPDSPFEISYEQRDLLGRVTKKVETSRTYDPTTITTTAEFHYTYDSRGRLKSANKRPSENSPWDEQLTYTYDSNGNRTKVETVTPTQTTTRNATYAADDALLCMSDGTTRTSYTYSPRGALASKVEMATSADCAATPTCAEFTCVETTYDYDAMGNLTTVILPDDTLIEHKSDAAGRRVEKRVNGAVVKRWLWDGQLRPIAEFGADGSVTSLFVYADGVNSPEYMIRPGVEDRYYTFVKDAFGSVRRVLDSDGHVMQAISYDAWGVPTATVGDLDYQPFGFAGGLWDADTGLVRFGARDYDAEVGRWTAKDPIRFDGGDVNLYAYTSSDPSNHVDPTGQSRWDKWFRKAPRAFKRWLHRVKEEERRSKGDDYIKEKMDALWDEWNSCGRPDPAKNKRDTDTDIWNIILPPFMFSPDELKNMFPEILDPSYVPIAASDTGGLG